MSLEILWDLSELRFRAILQGLSFGLNLIRAGTRGKKKPLQSQRLNKTLNPGASEITSVTVVEHPPLRSNTDQSAV
jgi:hypothetical protein